jgi:ABC-type phosphate/phosphonate transport system substrate-binding protein
VVLRSGLHPELKDRLRASLLAIGADLYTPPALAEYGLERFAPVNYEHYAPEEKAL